MGTSFQSSKLHRGQTCSSLAGILRIGYECLGIPSKLSSLFHRPVDAVPLVRKSGFCKHTPAYGCGKNRRCSKQLASLVLFWVVLL